MWATHYHINFFTQFYISSVTPFETNALGQLWPLIFYIETSGFEVVFTVCGYKCLGLFRQLHFPEELKASKIHFVN